MGGEERGNTGKGEWEDSKIETKIFYNLSSNVIYEHETIHYVYNSLKDILLTTQINPNGIGKHCTVVWIPGGKDCGAVLKAGYYSYI